MLPESEDIIGCSFGLSDTIVADGRTNVPLGRAVKSGMEHELVVSSIGL